MGLCVGAQGFVHTHLRIINHDMHDKARRSPVQMNAARVLLRKIGKRVFPAPNL